MIQIYNTEETPAATTAKTVNTADMSNGANGRTETGGHANSIAAHSASSGTSANTLRPCTEMEKGAWIKVVEPTPDELRRLSEMLRLDIQFLTDLNDGEEKSRVEYEADYTLIIIDSPVVELVHDSPVFSTVPLVMLLTQDVITTMCIKDTPILEEFRLYKQKNFRTDKPLHFVLQLLHKTSSYYIKFLKHIDRRTTEMEASIRRSTRNEELFELLSLEKTLVYFNIGLKANQGVARRLTSSRDVAGNESYTELIADVIIENEQALEMTQTYSHILSSLSDAFGTIISNKLNLVIKFLTSLTIVLLIPSIVAGFYGMNVALPLQDHPHAFTIIVIFTVVIVAVTLFIFARRRWL
ncbi:MAG: magnesium transporter CorA family protein [Rhizobacter sp.]|nr:magnesium transporter CorA family protein [Chlorobiales bacterium]